MNICICAYEHARAKDSLQFKKNSSFVFLTQIIRLFKRYFLSLANKNTNKRE